MYVRLATADSYFDILEERADLLLGEEVELLEIAAESAGDELFRVLLHVLHL